jgi:hypothetical protein
MVVEARVFRSIAEIDPADWNACNPGEAESHAYLRTARAFSE